MLDTDQQEQDEAVTAAVLAKRLNVVDYESGFAIRNCAGPRQFLNWQAGHMITERRFIRVSVSGTACAWQSVSLFRLLGYGASKDEAVLMAKKAGRNGQ